MILKTIVKKLLYVAIILFLLFIMILEYFVLTKDNDDIVETEPLIIIDEKEELPLEELIKVDIKGEINNPGVYEVSNNMIINDVITLAGGLTKNAYTSNLNLSKKLEDEMVIYIFNNSEFQNKIKSIDENVCNTNYNTLDKCIDAGKSIIKSQNENSIIINSLININTASIKDLQTLAGIGSAKAQSIIDYRNQNGLFESIEDIKKVSGIGNALFEKIKDYITV